MRLILLVLLGFYSVAALADDDCEEPKAVCQALEVYHEANEALDDGNWRLAVKHARKALSYVPRDQKLNYSVLCLAHENSGYMSGVTLVKCDRSSTYKPNQILEEIKQENPPKPTAIVMFSSVEDAWSENPDKIELSVNRFVISNQGGFDMEDVKIRLSDASGRSYDSNVGTVEGGTEWSSGGINRTFASPFVIRVDEKDNYGIN